MGLKFGKVVHLITPHLHTNFESSTSYSSQNILVEMFFLWKKGKKKHIILVCKLCIYIAMDLKLGMLVDIITQHVRFQVSIELHYEIMADFVISYNKKTKNWAPSGL